jgi:hypothetical protein
MNAPQLSFNPRWKEELVCTAREGIFILEMPMGITTVYFPPEAVWEMRAPAWAAGYWREIHDQLSGWCAARKIPVVLREDAWVDVE